MVRRLLALAASAVLLAGVAAGDALAQAPAGGVPEPSAHLAGPPGTDRVLSDWNQLAGYYRRLAAASDRVRLDTLGTTPEGRPLLMLTVTSVANHARLDELRQVQEKLADPRGISGPTERARLLDRGRAVVLITHGVHATEVGSAEMAPGLLYGLATADDPETRRILDETVVLQIPSLNPDGLDRVVRWYRGTVGRANEGEPMPWPDHLVGHDLNRDWYAFTQPETEAVVREVYHRWHPQVVHDVHQMGAFGARVFVPPYADPWEPNVDAALIASANALGSVVAARLLSAGHEGVVSAALFDAYSPARAYAHHHGGVRVLSETASARLASPVDLEPHELVPIDGFDPLAATWNHPRPWSGGRWGMPEAVGTMHAAARALLDQVARTRRDLLETSLGVAERASAGWDRWPAAWVVTPHPEDPARLRYLARALALGEVEAGTTTGAAVVDGTRVPAGSLVVPMRQPYASFAQALLEPREYPVPRSPGPDGAPRPPYDGTAHTLGLLLGLEAVPLTTVPDVRVTPLRADDFEGPLAFDTPDGFTGEGAPRLAVYLPVGADPAPGWARWLLERHAIRYDTVRAEHVRAGELGGTYETLLLDLEGAGGVGGELGDDGARALAAFVRGGGRLVAVQGGARAAIELLGLPVSDAVDRVPTSRFFVPGSIVGVVPAAGASSVPAWFERGSMAFDTPDPTVEVLANYAPFPLLAGWAIGADLIAGRPAALRVPMGAGDIVLFGFRPNYRGQSAATWPMLFRTLRGASSYIRGPDPFQALPPTQPDRP